MKTKTHYCMRHSKTHNYRLQRSEEKTHYSMRPSYRLQRRQNHNNMRHSKHTTTDYSIVKTNLHTSKRYGNNSLLQQIKIEQHTSTLTIIKYFMFLYNVLGGIHMLQNDKLFFQHQCITPRLYLKCFGGREISINSVSFFFFASWCSFDGCGEQLIHIMLHYDNFYENTEPIFLPSQLFTHS